MLSIRVDAAALPRARIKRPRLAASGAVTIVRTGCIGDAFTEPDLPHERQRFSSSASTHAQRVGLFRCAPGQPSAALFVT